MKDKETYQARKFTGVINNPLKNGFTHEAIHEKLESLSTFTYACVSDEVSTTGTPHTHFFVCYKNPKLWDTIRRLFNGKAFVESSKGSCQQNKDYIQKSGKWQDTKKHETIIEGTFEEWGKMPEDTDISIAPNRESVIFDQIQTLLKEGNTPKQILSVGTYMYKYEKYIKRAYISKLADETPKIRDVEVYYHTGRSGSGKSWTYVDLCEKYGEESVYLMTDYANGGTAGFDGYCGEPILFMDEFKNNLPYTLLLQILDKFKTDIHCRYHNVTALWSTIHITSVYSVDEIYLRLVDDSDRKIDSITQLIRRIKYMVYHYKTDSGEYRKIQIPMSEYKSLGQLEALAKADQEYHEKMQKLLKDTSHKNETISDNDNGNTNLSVLSMFGEYKIVNDKEKP